jgi:hypothetical protein
MNLQRNYDILVADIPLHCVEPLSANKEWCDDGWWGEEMDAIA